MHQEQQASNQKLPIDFFLLVFALAIPFWIFGGSRLPLPMALPFSSLMFVTPFLAALILTWRRSGRGGVQSLLKRAVDFRKIRGIAWYLPILLLNPLIMILSYLVMRMVGLPLPADPFIPWQDAPLLFVLFLVAAAGEEMGWTAYALDPMQRRWGPVKAGLVLGVVWALIHIIPDIQNGQAAAWIIWHRLGTVATRMIMVWIYNKTGKSVFSSILYHDMDNVSWSLFPNYGSHYNPVVTTLITIIIAAIVTLLGRSKAAATSDAAAADAAYR